jgi:hypothetical protein
MSTREQPRGLGGSKKIAGLEVRQYIDLSKHMGPSDFDDVMRAVSETIHRSTSLSLDDEKDRQALTKRIQFALGAVEG